jgi:hypothetical protein
MRRLDCHDRIKRLTSNYETALRTVQTLIRLAEQQPEHLYKYDLDMKQMRAVAEQLHDIYFTRMFACFESCLRDYWRAKIRDTKPRTEELISSIATRHEVPRYTLDVVQEVRVFRNSLIHEEHQAERRYTIDEAATHLNTYLARLPLQWRDFARRLTTFWRRRSRLIRINVAPGGKPTNPASRR